MTDQPDMSDADASRPEGPEEGLDPASQSLADALRVSFWILKAVMLLLVIAFLGWSRHSGFFTVPPQAKALVLRFGAIKEPGTPKDPGKHWSWPYPIDSREMVDVRVKSLEIETFMFSRDELSKTMTIDEFGTRMGSLVPGQDGCLITGDHNLLHALWTIEYQVSNVRQYLTSVAGEQELVKAVFDNAVLRTVAHFKADDVLSDRITAVQAEVKRRADEHLGRLSSGISVVSVNVKMPTPPLQVRKAFMAVTEAASEADQKIREAQRAASQILNDVAGAAHEPLAAAIDRYEAARRRKDQTAAKKHQAEIEALLLSDETKGAAGETIDAARSYKTNLIQEVRGEAVTFRRLKVEKDKNPEIVLRRLWEDTKQAVLEKAESKVFMLKGEPLMIDINEPPRWDQAEQEKKLQDVGRGPA